MKQIANLGRFGEFVL